MPEWVLTLLPFTALLELQTQNLFQNICMGIKYLCPQTNQCFCMPWTVIKYGGKQPDFLSINPIIAGKTGLLKCGSNMAFVPLQNWDRKLCGLAIANGDTWSLSAMGLLQNCVGHCVWVCTRAPWLHGSELRWIRTCESGRPLGTYYDLMTIMRDCNDCLTDHYRVMISGKLVCCITGQKYCGLIGPNWKMFDAYYA